MPKTSVNKDRDLFHSENEVGPTGKPLVPSPAGERVGLENSPERQLGFLVVARANSRHKL
jgi:hypothetical protein